MLGTNESQNEFGNQMSCGQIMKFSFIFSDVSKNFWVTTAQYDKTMGMFHQIIPEKFSWKCLKLPSDQLLFSVNISTLEALEVDNPQTWSS